MITFFVPGIPQPQGAIRTNPHSHRGYDANKNLAPWREAVIYAARAAHVRHEPINVAVAVGAAFTFPRPNSHYGTGRNTGQLKASAPAMVAVRPDLDHLQRAIGDALVMAGILRDDNLIVTWCASKHYGDKPGALIMIEPA